MLRKLLPCILLLLVLLTACRPTEDSTVYVEVLYPDGQILSINYQLFELHASREQHLLSQWAHEVICLPPYLFQVRTHNVDWQLVSTALDGTEETLWLDSTQLPEEYQEHVVCTDAMQLVDETLYVLLAPRADTSTYRLVAVGCDGSLRLCTLGEPSSYERMQIWNGQCYFVSQQTLMVLDTSTGGCAPMDVGPVDGLFYFDLFQIDNGILWYLDADYARTVCTLVGVDLETGAVKVRMATDGWLRGENVMQIHDGCLYYLSQEEHAATYTLWEIPLAALRDGVPSWEALFSDGGAAQALTRNLIYDEHLPPAQLLFGRRGLWMRYTTREDVAAEMGFAPGVVRYIPYAH